MAILQITTPFSIVPKKCYFGAWHPSKKTCQMKKVRNLEHIKRFLKLAHQNLLNKFRFLWKKSSKVETDFFYKGWIEWTKKHFSEFSDNLGYDFDLYGSPNWLWCPTVQGSIAGSIIQATGKVEFEDGLRWESSLEDGSPSWRLLVPLWQLHLAKDQFQTPLRVRPHPRDAGWSRVM